MIAHSLNAPAAVAGATGISGGDAVWLRAMRHSPISSTQGYQRLFQKAQASLRERVNALPKLVN